MQSPTWTTRPGARTRGILPPPYSSYAHSRQNNEGNYSWFCLYLTKMCVLRIEPSIDFSKDTVGRSGRKEDNLVRFPVNVFFVSHSLSGPFILLRLKPPPARRAFSGLFQSCICELRYQATQSSLYSQLPLLLVGKFGKIQEAVLNF